MVYRRIDVELLPVAPLRPVESPHPQIVGSRTALEVGARKLGCADVDILIATLRNASDGEMPAQGIRGRIPELVFRDGIAVSIARAKQAGGRDVLIVSGREVGSCRHGRV